MEEIIKNICKDYTENNLGLETLCSKYHLGKLKIKKYLSDNNIPLKRKGGQKLNTEYVISDFKTEKYPQEEGYHYIAKDKNSDFTTNDYMNAAGVLTTYIKNKYNVEIPNLHTRRQYYRTTGNYWWEQYFDIIKEENLPVKKCPYCDWTTIDINNNSGAFEQHLLKEHNISKLDYIKEYPEDKEYFKTSNSVIQRQMDNDIDNYVICKICNKKLARINKAHLQTHNITKQEYIEKYGSDNIISQNFYNILLQNINEVNKNMPFHKQSNDELEIIEFIKSFGYEPSPNRKILNGKEIDIYIPELKIGIEYNGCLFHTEEYGKDKHYHLNKTNICEQQGIQLIHIFSDEYKNNKDLILKKIQHILGCDKGIKIGARKCKIKEINYNTALSFLNKYHIQGGVLSSIYLGAYYQDELVAVMTFLKEKDTDWNLTRFASHSDYICSGIGGKLFKYFITNFDFNTIKSFADRRYSSTIKDNLYTKLGFILDKITPPEYRYYHPKQIPEIRHHKFGFRKQILHKKYNLPLTMTESEMSKELGYQKIWDCGLLRYVYYK